LAEEALKKAFEHTRPCPRGKSLQKENLALKEELKILHDDDQLNGLTNHVLLLTRSVMREA